MYELVHVSTRSWYVVPAELKHMRVIKDIATEETEEVHAVWMDSYTYSSLTVWKEVRKVSE